MDTIFALSSGAPPAAIAVVRVSGVGARDAVMALAGRLPPPRRAALATLRSPGEAMDLDRALILWFRGPNNATGEDLAEFHVHGGRAVVAAVLAALAGLPGLRAAEPGEFTRRALLNGRIDLAEAEGLGDLLMAETESQRRRALAAAEGEVSRAVNGWASTLLGLAARAEAQLDFADEDEVAGSKDATLAPDIATLAAQIRMVTDQPPVERLRDGVRVVLAGAPNTGKSTLFNAMAGRDAAIVSPIAGTTRDRIEAPVVRDGLAYLLIDTAGLAETTDDAIEAIGIMRSRDAMAMADIILWLDDAPPPADVAARLLWLYPRADRRNDQAPAQRLAVSAVTGEGMSALWDAVAKGAAGLLPREDRLAVNQRQRHLLIDALAALDAAAVLDDPVLAAEELRIARGALDRITGVTDVEAMLDTLFGRFCIGK